MKKIEFFKKWDDLGKTIYLAESEQFNILLTIFQIFVLLPFLFSVVPLFILMVIQELIILLFTIFSELIQLLKLAISRLFKLGDTK